MGAIPTGIVQLEEIEMGDGCFLYASLELKGAFDDMRVMDRLRGVEIALVWEGSIP